MAQFHGAGTGHPTFTISADVSKRKVTFQEVVVTPGMTSSSPVSGGYEISEVTADLIREKVIASIAKSLRG
jgi:hypothetical protein